MDSSIRNAQIRELERSILTLTDPNSSAWEDLKHQTPISQTSLESATKDLEDSECLFIYKNLMTKTSEEPVIYNSDFFLNLKEFLLKKIKHAYPTFETDPQSLLEKLELASAHQSFNQHHDLPSSNSSSAGTPAAQIQVAPEILPPNAQVQ
jgi:hypothetical protein